MKVCQKTCKSNVKLKVIITLFMISLVCFISAVSLTGTFATEESKKDVELKSQYTVGQTIEIPKGKVIIDENEVEVSPIVFFPDGTSYGSSTVKLNQTGKYTIEYSVEKDGKFYSKIKEFQVYDHTILNTTTQEPLKYLHNEQYDATGVHFSVCPNQKVVYNKIFDISDYGIEDSIIKIDAIPTEKGVGEARDLIILITDAYDEDNYITVRIRRGPPSEDQDNAYVTAAHNGNALSGWAKTTLYQGHSNYGSGFKNGLRGNWEVTSPIDIRIDYETKDIYTYHERKEGLSKVVNLANDFGDFGWNGFTTGEVKVTIWADTYATTNILQPFNGIIYEIGGENFSKLSNEEGVIAPYVVEKTNAPIVDFEEYGSADKIPNAMVGFAYKLFDTNYNSLFGQEKFFTRVYYGYQTSTCYEVPVENGYFTPDNEGVYTIVYTAIDRFGNRADTNVDVYAKLDEGKWLEVTVPNYENYTNGTYGFDFDLVPTKDVVVDGAFGSVDVSITARHVESGYMEVITNDAFVPKIAGEWKITYSAKDYCGRLGYFTYKAQVDLSDSVVFAKVKNFPKYLIVNASNPIPSASYVDYNVSDRFIQCDNVYAEKDGVKVCDILNGYFKPTEVGDYNIVYSAVSSKGKTSEQKINVKAVDVGFKDKQNFNLAKYFYSEDIENYFVDEDAAAFTLKANGVAQFIRPIDAVNFEFSFNIDGVIQAAEAISLLITDINNPNQVVKLTFSNMNGNVVMSINERTDYVLPDFKFGGGANFSVTIKTGLLGVGSVTTEIKDYLNGEPYEGFESLLANVSIKAEADENMVGNTKIYINRISGQKFYDAKSDGDIILPKIILSQSNKGRLFVGETVKIAKAKVIDVIDPYAVATLTVLGPNNKPIKDVDGLVLSEVDIEKDYYINVTEVGSYYVLYDYADSTESVPKPRGNAFQVVSREKPVIKVSGGDKSAKVGTQFTVGKAKVESISENVDLKVFVRAPEGNMKLVDIEKSYKVDAKIVGIYTICYVAVDEWGNMSTYEYTVKVS